MKRCLIAIILFLIFITPGRSQNLSTFADTARYLMQEIEGKKSQYIGKPFSLLHDSLKIKPVTAVVGKGAMFNNVGKYVYFKFNNENSSEKSCFIVAGFVTINGYDTLLPFFHDYSPAEVCNRITTSCKSLILKYLSVVSYREENPLFPGLGKAWAIQIRRIKREYIRNAKDKLTKRKTNRRNNPIEKLYFDATGNLITYIRFNDNIGEPLSTIAYARTFVYCGNKRVKEMDYRSRRNDTLYLHEVKKTTYDSTDNPLTDSTFYYEKDLAGFFVMNPGLISKRFAAYEYLQRPKRIKYILNPDFYYLTTFDSTGRACAQEQFVNNKIRWEWNFTYIDNKRIGQYRTHYNNQFDNAEEQIVIYNAKNQAVTIERKWKGEPHMNTKKNFFYNKKGLLKKIEEFEANPDTYIYEPVSYTRIKIKSKVKLTAAIVKRVAENN